MTGLLMATLSGDEQFLVAKDFHLFGQIGIVIVAEDALLDVFRIHAALRGGIRVRRDLIGAQVITQSGKLLGRIADVYVMEEQLRIIYRVTSSRFQEVFGLGQYMLGDLSHRWSECGKRLIVAPHTAERDVFSSLKEAIRFAERRSAFAGVEE